MEEIIIHHICYIPEIRVEVTKRWLAELAENREETRDKRQMLLAAIKRWIYLSWILQTITPKSVKEAYDRSPIWEEIGWIKKSVIPEIVAPHKVVWITPYYELQTGRLIQFDKNKNPIELDFSVEQPAKPILK